MFPPSSDGHFDAEDQLRTTVCQGLFSGLRLFNDRSQFLLKSYPTKDGEGEGGRHSGDVPFTKFHFESSLEAANFGRKRCFQ